MEHYIIVKFKNDYDYLYELENIKELFNETLKIDGVKKVDIYNSNSSLSNRHDLMIKMELTKEGLTNFDNSSIHKKWKEEYGKHIENKTIFDCE